MGGAGPDGRPREAMTHAMAPLARETDSAERETKSPTWETGSVSRETESVEPKTDTET